MHAAKAATALIPAIIGAIGAMLAAVLSFVAAIRAQSRRQLLDDIDDLLRKYADAGIDELKEELRAILDARTRGLYIGEIVKRGLREVFRERAGEARDEERKRKHRILRFRN